jgi:hypothetical protein
MKTKAKANLLSFLLILSPGLTNNTQNNVNVCNSDTLDYNKIITKASNLPELYDELKPYKEVLIAMLCQESSYNKFTTGDGGRAKGCLHIHKSFVDNLNKQLKDKNINRIYTYENRLSVEKSIKMFLDFQLIYNPTKDLRLAAIMWNCGQNCNPNSVNANKYWNIIQKRMSNPIDTQLAERLINSKDTICV